MNAAEAAAKLDAARALVAEVGEGVGRPLDSPWLPGKLRGIEGALQLLATFCEHRDLSQEAAPEVAEPPADVCHTNSTPGYICSRGGIGCPIDHDQPGPYERRLPGAHVERCP